MRPILNDRNCWTVSTVCSTGILVDGHDYYRAFYHAARSARRSLLISGWQFDSETRLLRGHDRGEAEEDIRFIEFLNELCEGNPDLEIYLLAWDFSLLFMLEREWLQEWIFNWTTNERIRFRFERTHPLGASQHQKFVVIDGSVAFMGGMDICAGRWDTRHHHADHPDRVTPDGERYGPYHEVQTYHTGPVARELAALFKVRWQLATSEPLILHEPLDSDAVPLVGIDYGIALPPGEVALSRTQATTLSGMQPSVTEIKQLYLDAVTAAERLIYIENQYFSSWSVSRALIERMEDPSRPKLQIIIILPRRPQDFMEEIAVGVTQAKTLLGLKETARRTGHAVGIYYPVSAPGGDEGRPIYVHSKLLIVDDRFLTVGSANTTNRSMGLDVELNASWEARSLADYDLIRSLRRVRLSLLAELSGLSAAALHRRRDLVGFLDSRADLPEGRLRCHTLETMFDDNQWLKPLKTEVPFFDPERTLIEEDLYALASSGNPSLFADGITLLKQWLSGRRETAAGPES